ncbi:MAG: CdvA-like protein [Sulfolobaceae archaeon]|jgi:vacuolar-type H+-ATPase subunit I/STV1|nr:CdvA-like protein [Sulfolobales archaeon]MCG2883325.1 CdvA-like protein [Sulfolobales archaeon]MCG2908075.1 CdvA-like protein [Sulfolobales archaeon]MCQ4384877.1 CdvA-like protein [Sulfolobales archaeon]MCQ4406794.1 CdvA-like protein [Sulfolobales archaeon]
MTVPSESLVKSVGQLIKDVYGREIGYIVSVNTEVDGSVTEVAIARDSTIMVVDPSRFKLEGDTLVIIPEWKAETQKVTSSLDKIRRKLKALEELYNRGEIDRSDYEEMKRKFNSESNKLKESVSKLKSTLKNRLSEIDEQLMKIERTLISLKIGYLSAEIDERAYKSSLEQLKKIKESYIQEKDDIRKTLDKLDSMDKENVTELKPVTPVNLTPEPVQQGEAKKPEIPSVVSVKVLNTL